MGHAERAGYAGGNWAEDHAEVAFNESAFQASRAVSRALDLDDCSEILETTDDEWFEDDLLSLIQNRPSRNLRRHN